MAKYLLYREDSGIDRDKVIEYLGTSKLRDISTPEELGMALKQLFSEIIIVIGSTATSFDLFQTLQASKLKTNTTLITRSLQVAHQYSSKVPKIIVLDKYSKEFPTYWGTALTSITNMSNLSRRNEDSLKIKGDSLYYHEISLELFEDYQQLVLQPYSNKDFVKQVKKDLTDKQKNIKKMVSQHGKQVKKDLNININADLDANVFKDMEQFLVKRKYLTYEQIEQLNSVEGDAPIEVKACSLNMISNEELVSAVNQFYDIEMINKEYLQNLTIEYKSVTKALRNKGVLEAYTSNGECVIVISYTDRDRLYQDITSTINYSKILYTTPDYISRMVKSV